MHPILDLLVRGTTRSRAAGQREPGLDPHKNTQTLTPYGANVISPEVREDRTVTFRVKAPDARNVALTGGRWVAGTRSS